MSNADNHEDYDAAIQHLFADCDAAWRSFESFLLAQTVFLAFLLQNAFANQEDQFTFRIGAFGASIVGIVICVLWWACCARNFAYMKLRVLQARNIEPKDWSLLNGVGLAFSEGKEVTIGKGHYRMRWYARLRASYTIYILILIFAIVYGLIAVSSGPWCSSVKADKNAPNATKQAEPAPLISGQP
jgi:hypothetical protein